MEPNADQAKASESEPGSKPSAANDLKSLPMPELQAKGRQLTASVKPKRRWVVFS